MTAPAPDGTTPPAEEIYRTSGIDARVRHIDGGSLTALCGRGLGLTTITPRLPSWRLPVCKRCAGLRRSTTPPAEAVEAAAALRERREL